MTVIAWSATEREAPDPRLLPGAAVVHRPGPHHRPAQVIERCREGTADALIVISSIRVYGALPGHDMHFDESTPIADDFDDPELADLAAADAEYAAAAASLTERAHTSIAVLRPAHVTGDDPSPLVAVLANDRLHTHMGYDPIVPLLHHADLQRAIDAAIEHRLRGVFNVAGPGSLPLSVLARESGTDRVGGIGGMVCDLTERFGALGAARYAKSELCYPIIASDEAFRSATGWQPQRTLPETVAPIQEYRR